MFSKLMEKRRVAELAKEKGNVAFKDKDYATAKSLFSHAITFDPSNHIYPLNRSMTNLRLARWDDAEADATKTLELSPNNLKALFRRGVARKELRKWDQARIDIETFIGNGGDATPGAQELKAISDLEKSPPSEPSSYASSDLDSGLANLHLQDDSSPFITHSSATIQGGEGAFASRDIQRGDLILSERPIFCIPSAGPALLNLMAAVEKLSPVHLDHFLSLQNSHIDCSCFRSPIFGIFHTNAFAFSEDGSDMGICLRGSRFNHSCSPNAGYSFNSNTGEHRVYALGSIPLGEEIFVAYIRGRELDGSPRRSRQANLRARYHFTCACTVCSLPDAESKISDARRVKLNELWEIISSFTPMQGIHLGYVVEATVQAIHLLKEEGYLADADEFTDEAGVVCAFHSDWVSAKYWAGLAYHTRVAEIGKDNPRVAEVRERYLNPRSYPLAGCGPHKSLAAFRV